MAAPARRSLSPDMVSLAFECFEAVDACVCGARVEVLFFLREVVSQSANSSWLGGSREREEPLRLDGAPTRRTASWRAAFSTPNPPTRAMARA